MKPTIETLKIMMLYSVKTERQLGLPGRKPKLIDVPTGEVHICKIITRQENGKTVSEPDIFTICGIERSKVGESYKYSEKRPNLPMCHKCEDRWKRDPLSPWFRWQSGAPLALLVLLMVFASLACMTSAGLEEVGTAAPSTAPYTTGSQPPEPTGTENPAGEVFEIPAEWAEPQGYQLCAIVTASQSLHLRSEPNEHSTIREWLLSGEQVHVLEPGGEWAKVRTIAGLEGWAKAKYLQEEKCQ